MKNAVSNVWLLGLVILFIMSFTGFLAVTVSYSRAFKIKDMALTKIENYGGVTDGEPLPKKDLSSVIGVIISQNYIKVYQNGSILKTHTCNNSNVLNFTNNYYIGKRADNGDRKAKYIYSFKIYNRELTEDEIIRNYNYEMAKPISLNGIEYFEDKEVI